jgi:hypothetical protein
VRAMGNCEFCFLKWGPPDGVAQKAQTSLEGVAANRSRPR